MGSRTSINLGTVCSRYRRMVWSKRTIWMLVSAVETPSSLTKERIAPGGTPRRRRATSVKSLGSSHPRTMPLSTSFAILRFERMVPVILSLPYLGDFSLLIAYMALRGVYTPSALACIPRQHHTATRTKPSIVETQSCIMSAIYFRSCHKDSA